MLEQAAAVVARATARPHGAPPIAPPTPQTHAAARGSAGAHHPVGGFALAAGGVPRARPLARAPVRTWPGGPVVWRAGGREGLLRE